MLKLVRLAAKLLWREWRAGEWFIVFFALLLSVISITTLEFFSERVMKGLDEQSAKLLGGDLVISSPIPLPAEWQKKAETLQLKTAEVWLYPSVISAKNNLKLINLQAVSKDYPLLENSNKSLAQNTASVDARLLSLLSIKLNESISIGAATFKVSALLTNDTDVLNTGWLIAPRVMIRLDDVPQTKTVVPGSRIDYRLLMVGDKIALQKFGNWVIPQLRPGQRLLNVHNQQFVLHEELGIAENYFNLALLICFMLCGVAISLSVQQYLRRHYSHVALWRSFGAQKKQIIALVLIQLGMMICLSALIGTLIGYVSQYALALLLQKLLQFSLPPAGIMPFFSGIATSFVLVIVFAYPVVSELPQTSPLYIWRNDIKINLFHAKLFFLSSLIVLTAFVGWLTHYSTLTLFFLNMIAVAIALFYALILFILFLMRKVLSKTTGTIRQGLSQLVQHPDTTSLQFIGLSLIVMLLCVLNFMRTDIVSHWQQRLPINTPNYFAINIAPTDLVQFKEFFHQEKINFNGIYPMVRGRLIKRNHFPILSVVPVSARHHNALNRELNLSWMLLIPANNKIVLGNSWNANTKKQNLLSVEHKLGTELGLKIGDILTFQIGDQEISGEIANFRTVDWNSFQPNFFIIFQPGSLAAFPTTFITSFYLKPEQTNVLNKLINTFPNLTIIDVASILIQVQDVVSKITFAAQYLFLFSLGAGILIFIASVQASSDERRATYRLWRILGASKQYIYRSLFTEFSALIVIIILAAVIIAKVAVFLLEKHIFGF